MFWRIRFGLLDYVVNSVVKSLLLIPEDNTHDMCNKANSFDAPITGLVHVIAIILSR